MNHHYESPASEVLNRGRGIMQSHRPAFWLYAILFVTGVIFGFQGLGTALANISVMGGLAFFGTFVFAALALWLIFQLSDLDPKPASVAAAAFFSGALITTFFVQFTSGSLTHIFSQFTSNPQVSGALSAATGEEYFKALTVVLVFLIVPWWWQRPLDGIVFGALVGLGFQIYEDIIYISGTSGVNTGAFGAGSIFFNRIVLTGLFSHAVFTAFFGMGLGYAVTADSASKVKRIAAVVGGFVMAWAAHTLWDLPILFSLVQKGPLGTFLYTFLKSLPFILILIPLVIKALREEREFFHRSARPEIKSGTLSPEDIARLDTFMGRFRARRAPKGHQAKSRLQHLMRTQLDLVRLHFHGLAEPEIIEAQRTFVEQLRES